MWREGKSLRAAILTEGKRQRVQHRHSYGGQRPPGPARSFEETTKENPKKVLVTEHSPHQ